VKTRPVKVYRASLDTGQREDRPAAVAWRTQMSSQGVVWWKMEPIVKVTY
jgi:hypothetical protein